MNKNEIRSLVVPVILATGLAGCLGDCKSVIVPANPNLDPVYIKASESGEGSLGDPMRDQQWSARQIGMQEVWSEPRYSGAKRLTVAVIGTGVDYTHEDLNANIFVNLQEAKLKKPGQTVPVDRIDDDGNGYVDDVLGYDFVEDDGYPFDRTGAGTAAAGIIGAVHNNGKGIQGLNSQISLLPIRYIDQNGNGSLADLYSALEYSYKARVDLIYLQLVNLGVAFKSQSQSKNLLSALAQLMNQIDRAGIPVVVGAGNMGSNLANAQNVTRFMTQFSNVVVVTSSDTKDKRPFIANYGKEFVHTSAPGVEVLTTLPGNSYGMQNGTAIAAAHVAGALALAKSIYYGKKSAAELIAGLLSDEASDPVNVDQQYETLGGNRLNVAKYLKYLEKN